MSSNPLELLLLEYSSFKAATRPEMETLPEEVCDGDSSLLSFWESKVSKLQIHTVQAHFIIFIKFATDGIQSGPDRAKSIE